MINILGSSEEVPKGQIKKFRLRIEGLPDTVGKGELRALLQSRCKSTGSLDIERSQSQDSSVQRTALFSVTDEKDKDRLLSQGLEIEGKVLRVTQEIQRGKHVFEDDSQNRVFVTNIPYGTSDANLMKFFNKFGPCKQDSIGRISPTGKELTFCTLTFQDSSTAQMLVAKKTMEFNGRKLKLIEYDRNAEGKLDQHVEGTLDYLLKGQSQKSRRKNSNQQKREKSPQQLLMCERCLSTKFITKCVCPDAPMFKMQIGGSKIGSSTMDSPENRTEWMHKKFPLDSPEIEIGSEPRIQSLNIMGHLKQTGLFDREKIGHGEKFPVTINKSAPVPTQVPKCKDQLSKDSNRSKSAPKKQRRRFASEQADDNHFEGNLRFNKRHKVHMPNINPPP